MSKHEDRIGKRGQELAASALCRVGVLNVEKIGTPVKLIPHPHLKDYYRVIWEERVSGDHRGILPGGRSVLVETKTIMDRNLRWSDFREHQPGQLNAHHEAGGLSLVVLVNERGAHVLRWPIPGFGPGKSISQERASDLDILTISDVTEHEKTAAEEALDDICALLDAPDWEYPGQVVRDVARAINMSIERMAEKLKKVTA